MEKRIIAVVMTRPQREYNMEIVRSLHGALSSRGFVTMVFGGFTDLISRDANDYGEKSIYTLIPYDKIAGLIVLAGTFQDSKALELIISRAQKRHIPVLSLDYAMPGIASCVHDYEGAFATMVRHVIQHHRCHQVYMIAGIKDNEYSQKRIDVFREICRERGISMSEAHVYYGDFWEAPARAAVDEMLEEGALPQAIICANDVMAIAAINHLKELGYRVPEDVIVTGMDGIEYGRYYRPRLSTIETDNAAMCERAARMMEEFLQSGSYTAVTELVPMAMDYEASCGCRMDHIADVGERFREISDAYGALVMNEGQRIRMRHKLLDRERPEIFEIVQQYLFHECWICCNEVFWESMVTDDATERKEYDYYEEDGCYDWEMLSMLHYVPAAPGQERVAEYSETYRCRDLLPNIRSLLEDHDLFVFYPLNFQNEVIGYLAFCGFDGSRDMYYYSQMAMNLSTVLRVTRDRERGQYMMEMLQHSNSVLYDLSIHDALTGLLNRRGLMQGLEEACKAEQGRSRQLYYGYIDIDGFKGINDEWGHDEGDEVLKIVAQTLVRALRDYPQMLTARIGGDEFVIFGAVTGAAEIEWVTRAVKDAFAHINDDMDKDYLISLSIGSAVRDELSIEAAQDCIKEADDRMYKAKKKRKALQLRTASNKRPSL